MLTIIGFALRNEHRMTLLEGQIELEKALRGTLEQRVDKLEDTKT